MTILDFVIIGMAAVGFIAGFAMGFVKQLSFGAGIAFGLLQAVVSFDKVGAWLLEKTGWADWLCSILGFVLVLAAVMIVLRLAALIFSWLLDLLHLRIVDRGLGALFTAYVAMLLLAVVVNLSDRFTPDSELFGKTSQAESLLYEKVVGRSVKVIEEVKKEITVDEKAE